MIEKKNHTINVGMKNLLAVFVILIALCRCFSFNVNAVLLFGIAFTIMAIIFSKQVSITNWDFLLDAMLIILLINKNECFSWWNCLYVIFAWLAFYAFRDLRSITMVLKTIAIFSIINIIVNVINMVNVNTYFSLIAILLNEDSVTSATYYYKTQGFLSGLSDHYSRNAYFCVGGACVFAAILFGDKTNVKNKVKVFTFLLMEIVMMMIIGKRGHLLYFMAALIIVYLLMEPKISKRITRFLKLLIVIGIVLALVIEVIPSAAFVFERFALQIANGDVSTGRFALWTKAWNYFIQKPIWGWGYGFFNTHVMNETLNVYFAGVHNDYLQWLCEQGLVGFVLNMLVTFGMNIFSIKTLKKILQHQENNRFIDRVLIIWSVLFQTFVILYSLTGLPHFEFEINIIYYISMAVPIVISSNENNGVKTWKKIKW